MNKNLANKNHYPTLTPSVEEQNELDALDIVIGLSSEERSYLLSVWRSRNPISVADPLHQIDELSLTGAGGME